MLDIKSKSDLSKIEAVQKHFLEQFSDSRTDGGRGVVQFVAPPLLQFQHVRNCRVFVNRHAMMLELAARNACCAEVGVLKGEFSDFIMKRLEPSELYLFDIDFEAHKIVERFSAELRSSRLHLVHGDSSTKLSEFDDGFFDWIYVDGDHTYEGCRKDLDAAIRKIKPEGLIFVNDYLMWSHTECRPYGVVFAVNEICVDHDFELVGFALHGGMYCDVALRRIGVGNRKARPSEVIERALSDATLGNYFEVELAQIYRRLLQSGGLSIDGGSNSGVHAQGMARAMGSSAGGVVAFEPLPGIAEKARRWASREGLSNVIQFEVAALGDSDGEVTFFESHRHGAYSSLRRISASDQYSELRVIQRSLDSYLIEKGHDLASVKFIKLDLEGGEYHAIVGARETIAAARPVVCFENARDWAAQIFEYPRDGVLNLFQELGYNVYDFFGRRMTPAAWGETRAFMFVAVPSESRVEADLLTLARKFWEEASDLDVSTWEKTVLQILTTDE